MRFFGLWMLLMFCLGALGCAGANAPSAISITPKMRLQKTTDGFDAYLLADTKRIMTQQSEGHERVTLLVWDATTLEQVQKISGASALFESANLSADGSTLLTFGASGVNAWTLADGAKKYALHDNALSLLDFAMYADRTRFVLVSSRYTSETYTMTFESAEYDAGSGKLLRAWQSVTEPLFGVAHVAYSPDGKWFALLMNPIAVRDAAELVVWDTASGNLVTRVQADFFRAPGAFTWLGDSSGIVIGVRGENLRVVDPATGKPLKPFSFKPNDVLQMQSSADGALIALLDGGPGLVKLRMLDAASGKQLFQREVAYPRASLAFSSDGKILAMGNRFATQYGGVDLFDAHTGAQFGVLSADGKMLTNPAPAQYAAIPHALAAFEDDTTLLVAHELDGRKGVVMSVWDLGR